MKPRRLPLNVQLALSFAFATLATGSAFVAVSFGLVERNTAGLSDALIGLAVITSASVVVGWGVARHALKPLQQVTTRAQQITASNLDQRIALEGPDDELQQLSITIDQLLARLEASFERERRFVANASHEIRTPLAVTRTTLELGLDAPNPSVADLRSVITRALEATGRSETLAADLLLLARSERVAIDLCEHFDLAELTEGVVDDLGGAATAKGLGVSLDFAAAPMMGNASLVDRLVANLVDNAIRYTVPPGTISVTVRSVADAAVFVVRNSPTSHSSAPVGELLEPFRRGAMTSDRAATGHGLGLSIVSAIAAGHGAALRIERPENSDAFEVEVRFGGSGSSSMPPASVRLRAHQSTPAATRP